MDGKKLIFVIIIISVIAIIGTLLWGEYIIEKYDLERAMSSRPFLNYFV